MPLEGIDGLQPGDRVVARRDDALLRVGPGLVGRALVREALALYHDSQDLIQLGAYAAGTNPKLDACIRVRPSN